MSTVHPLSLGVRRVIEHAPTTRAAERRFAVTRIGVGALGLMDRASAGGSGEASTAGLPELALALIVAHGVVVLGGMRWARAKDPARWVRWSMLGDLLLAAGLIVSVPGTQAGFVAVVVALLAMFGGVRYGMRGAMAGVAVGAVAEGVRQLVASSIVPGHEGFTQQSVLALGLAAVVGVLSGMLADDARRAIGELQRHDRLASADPGTGVDDAARALVGELAELGTSVALLVTTGAGWRIAAATGPALIPGATVPGSLLTLLTRASRTGVPQQDVAVDVPPVVAGGDGRCLVVPARLHDTTLGALVCVDPVPEATGGPAQLERLSGQLGLVIEAARALERELRLAGRHQELHELQSTFVAVASHELRTPLTALVGFIETLQVHGERLDATTHARLLERMQDQGRRLQRLIEDLNVMASIDSGAVRYQVHELRVADVVDLVAERADGAVTIAPGPPEARAAVDPLRLAELLGHLVDNALTHGAPPIQITWDADESGPRLLVTDRGAGIPPSDHEWVFDRFVQLEDVNHHTGGRGLGLSIARAHARAMGGDVTVETSRRGGTRLVVTLAAAGQVSAPAGPS